jgi:hypothetical protein
MGLASVCQHTSIPCWEPPSFVRVHQSTDWQLKQPCWKLLPTTWGLQRCHQGIHSSSLGVTQMDLPSPILMLICIPHCLGTGQYLCGDRCFPPDFTVHPPPAPYRCDSRHHEPISSLGVPANRRPPERSWCKLLTHSPLGLFFLQKMPKDMEAIWILGLWTRLFLKAINASYGTNTGAGCPDRASLLQIPAWASDVTNPQTDVPQSSRN